MPGRGHGGGGGPLSRGEVGRVLVGTARGPHGRDTAAHSAGMEYRIRFRAGFRELIEGFYVVVAFYPKTPRILGLNVTVRFTTKWVQFCVSGCDLGRKREMTLAPW